MKAYRMLPRAGLPRWSALVALIAIAVAAVAAPAAAEKRVALVIGSSAYQAPLPALPNPLRDAADIGRALEAIGFETTVKTDVKRRELYQLIDACAAKIAGSPDNGGAILLRRPRAPDKRQELPGAGRRGAADQSRSGSRGDRCRQAAAGDGGGAQPHQHRVRDRDPSPAEPVQQLADRRLDGGWIITLDSIQEAVCDQASDICIANFDHHTLTAATMAIAPSCGAASAWPVLPDLL